MGDHSTNNNWTSGSAVEEGEDTISLAELLQESDDVEDMAVAVLGASDREQCSYDQGYVKRQALYACLTCNHPDSPSYTEAGICLACSLKCHRDHDLVELYTKRNFRCDCGNKKFASSGTLCQLQPVKSDFNSENTYNHNFRGLYCICSRPYPDPEEDEEDLSGNEDDSMIQCIVCEDWLHGRHTENDDVDLDSDLIQTSDFICKACTQKCAFLVHYGEYMLKATSVNETDCPLVVSTANDNAIEAPASENNAGPQIENRELVSEKTFLDENETKSDLSNGTEAEGFSSGDEKDSGFGDENSVTTVTKNKNTEASIHCTGATSKGTPATTRNSCFLELNTADDSLVRGGTWWLKDWRQHLCKCEKCMANYEYLRVEFLVDPDDPLEVYEAHGREKVKDNPTPGAGGELRALFGEMDHVKQIEVVHAFNEMKEGLSELVERVSAAGRPLSREDVQVFFEALQNKRRRLSNAHIPPDSCR